MDLVGIGGKLAEIAGTVPGIVKTFGQHPDALASTPCAVACQPRGDITPGSRQVAVIAFPVRFYVERVADDARSSVLANGLVNGFITALALHSSQTGLWTEIQRIAFDADVYYEVAGARYLAVDFTITILVRETATYAAA